MAKRRVNRNTFAELKRLGDAAYVDGRLQEALTYYLEALDADDATPVNSQRLNVLIDEINAGS